MQTPTRPSSPRWGSYHFAFSPTLWSCLFPKSLTNRMCSRFYTFANMMSGKCYLSDFNLYFSDHEHLSLLPSKGSLHCLMCLEANTTAPTFEKRKGFICDSTGMTGGKVQIYLLRSRVRGGILRDFRTGSSWTMDPSLPKGFWHSGSSQVPVFWFRGGA